MSSPHLIDAHAHLQFAAFREDADLVIQRALDTGIWMVNVGTQQSTSRAAVELAHRYPQGVYATVGLHPIHTDKSFHDEQELGGDKAFTSRGEEFDSDFYRRLAQDPKVVAIGECGLDYYRLNEDSKKNQKKAFLEQIKLAYEMKKPLMIHCRAAFDDLIKLLNSSVQYLNSPPGIVHFFSGGMDHAQKLLDLGFCFTFGGVITFAKEYGELVKYIPLDRMLVETDAPYVAPASYRGKRNEPLYVTEIAKRIAELKDVEVEIIGEATVRNTRGLLKI